MLLECCYVAQLAFIHNDLLAAEVLQVTCLSWLSVAHNTYRQRVPYMNNLRLLSLNHE